MTPCRNQQPVEPVGATPEDSRDVIRAEALPLAAAAVLRKVAETRAAQREPFDRRRAWRAIERRMAETAAGEHRLLAHGRFGALRVALSMNPKGGWIAAFSGGALVVAALLWFAFAPAPALSYRVEGGGVLVDDTVTTTDRPGLIVFSDSSRLRVAAQSELRVLVQGSFGANAELDRGRVVVDVAHERDTRWTIVAGPHRIHVTGTRFAVEWEPTSQHFVLDMHEGQVRVSGPLADGGARVLSAGERVVWQVAARSTEASANVDAKPKATLKVEAPVTSGGDAPLGASDGLEAPAPAPPVRIKGGRGGAVRDSAAWGEHLRQGRYREIVRDAKAIGVERCLQTRPAAELKILAQAASYAGETPLARKAWGAIRTRFGGGAAGAEASFFLGRIEERSGSLAVADGLYSEYLAKGRHTAYAGEALGRRMAIADARGNKDLARQLAKRYLASYEAGAYSIAARNLSNDAQ